MTWVHDDENRPPVTPDPGQPGPQEPIRGDQLRPFSRRALEYANLVAKRQNLRLKSDVVAKHGRQHGKECRQNIEHWITIGEE